MSWGNLLGHFSCVRTKTARNEHVNFMQRRVCEECTPKVRGKNAPALIRTYGDENSPITQRNAPNVFAWTRAPRSHACHSCRAKEFAAQTIVCEKVYKRDHFSVAYQTHKHTHICRMESSETNENNIVYVYNHQTCDISPSRTTNTLAFGSFV